MPAPLSDGWRVVFLRRRLHWGLAAVAGLALLALLMRAPLSSSRTDMGGIAFNSMQWHVRVRALPAGLTQQDLQQQLQRRLDVLDAILSTWRVDSELSQLNRAPAGVAWRVSETLFDAIETANRASEMTAGAYDITVAPLVNLWGFGPRAKSEHAPTQPEIDGMLQRVGWRYLALDRAASRITRLADVEIDLSSVGEGVACDELAALLQDLGVVDYTVAVAGAVRTKGKKAADTPWQIAIEKPDASGDAQRLVPAPDFALASAGSYRNYRELDGKRYSHILDARTGRPITHRGVQVTVITSGAAQNTTYADALDTALEVLGPVEGFALAERHGIAALFIEKSTAGFIEHPTSAFSALVTTLPAASDRTARLAPDFDSE